jgi:hypothetical protein
LNFVPERISTSPAASVSSDVILVIVPARAAVRFVPQISSAAHAPSV